MSLGSVVVITGVMAAAIVLGAIVFFSLVVAPLIFIKLPADVSGPFIRQVFPVYYLSLGIVSALSGALLSTSHRVEAIIMLAVGAVFIGLRQILMPKINELRDRQLRGEPGAEGNAFGLLHRLSVVINYVQLAAVAGVIIRLLH